MTPLTSLRSSIKEKAADMTSIHDLRCVNSMLLAQCATRDGTEGEKRACTDQLPHLIDTLQCILCSSVSGSVSESCKRMRRDDGEDGEENGEENGEGREKDREKDGKKKEEKKKKKKRKLSAE
eukprot:TRINITY_DN483_c0_g1_i6.p2 TRINITY_DN483_c0_g1~~TRINITY_DN483_c0_g1_i6.p2  ORF type:complete len:123 (-),score=52.28 TRINITY_DN483_c0_g1_i6:511-879(-)